ncbi:MAG: tetratricopeptide repeat protein [Arcobacteraceae bacterium]
MLAAAIVTIIQFFINDKKPSTITHNTQSPIIEKNNGIVNYNINNTIPKHEISIKKLIQDIELHFGNEFNEKKAQEDVGLINQDKVNLHSYKIKKECEKFVDYSENYSFEYKTYPELKTSKNQDISDAIKICSNAAKLNPTDLQYNYYVAVFYYKSQKYKLGFNKLKDTALKGYKIAQRKLGIMYLIGNNEIKKDISKANYWLIKSAQNGDKVAQRIIDKIDIQIQ